METSIMERDLEPHILKALDKTAEERINIISQGIWIRYPKADQFLRHLERVSRQPRSIRMQGCLIVGPTGNGKTSIVQEFIDNQKQKSGHETTSDFEYLYTEAPEIPSVKALYVEILSACHVIVKTGTAEQLKQRVLIAMRNLEVKMLFIDEIHNLLTAQTDRILTQCRNALKGLSNRLRIPIVLIGTEEAEEVLEGDIQVINRYPVIRLEPWNNDDNFVRLLYAFETQLPLRKASKLHEREIAQKILTISLGVLGNVAVIIRECGIEAIENGTERISIGLIEKLQREGVFQFKVAKPKPKTKKEQEI